MSLDLFEGPILAIWKSVFKQDSPLTRMRALRGKLRVLDERLAHVEGRWRGPGRARRPLRRSGPRTRRLSPYYQPQQDVMDAVQVVRRRAQEASHLKTTAQQTVAHRLRD